MLDQDDDTLLLNLSDLNLDLSHGILINRKRLLILVLTLFLFISILHAIIFTLFGLLFICVLILFKQDLMLRVILLSAKVFSLDLEFALRRRVI